MLLFREQRSKKNNVKHKGKSQGHKVIDRRVIWKGIISRVYMPII